MGKISNKKQKEGKFMILFFILIFFFLLFMTLKIKIELNNFCFDSLKKIHIAKNYEIKITLKTLYIIPILSLKFNDDKTRRIFENKKIKEKIQERELSIDKNTIKFMKRLKIDVDSLNLRINVGTEDAALTAIIIPIISTLLSSFLCKHIKKINNNQKYEINPQYINQNLFNIEISGIFQIELRNIINMLIILNKRKGDKNANQNRQRFNKGFQKSKNSYK